MSCDVVREIESVFGHLGSGAEDAHIESPSNVFGTVRCELKRHKRRSAGHLRALAHAMGGSARHVKLT